MTEIKPVEIDGEWRCTRKCDAENQLNHDHFCPHAKHDETGYRGICWPYYRATVAEQAARISGMHVEIEQTSAHLRGCLSFIDGVAPHQMAKDVATKFHAQAAEIERLKEQILEGNVDLFGCRDQLLHGLRKDVETLTARAEQAEAEIERLREREEHYIEVADALTEAEAVIELVREGLEGCYGMPGHKIIPHIRALTEPSAEPTSEGE